MSSFTTQVGNHIVTSRPWTGGSYYRVPVNGTYPAQNIRLPVNGTSWTTPAPCSCPTSCTCPTYVPVVAAAPIQYVPCVVVEPVQPQPTVWYPAVGDFS